MDGVNFAAIVIGVLILLYAMGHLHDALIEIINNQYILGHRLDDIKKLMQNDKE